MKKLINGRTEEEILNNFYALVAENEWFSWVDDPEVNGYHTELNVDEILTDDFEEFAQGYYNLESETEQYENTQDMYRSAGL